MAKLRRRDFQWLAWNALETAANDQERFRIYRRVERLLSRSWATDDEDLDDYREPVTRFKKFHRRVLGPWARYAYFRQQGERPDIPTTASIDGPPASIDNATRIRARARLLGTGSLDALGSIKGPGIRGGGRRGERDPRDGSDI